MKGRYHHSSPVSQGRAHRLFFFLTALLVLPPTLHAWSPDYNSYPSNDQLNEVQIELSIFQLQIFHPWSTGDFLDEDTSDVIRTTTESVLSDAFDEEFQGTALNLSSSTIGFDSSNDVQGVSFQSLELEAVGVEKLRRLSVATSPDDESTPSCPCSTISLAGTANFARGSRTAPTLAARSSEDDNTTLADSTHPLNTAYVDVLVREWLRHGGPRSSELEDRLQNKVAFFSEGQGFAVRLVVPIDDTIGVIQTTSSPTGAPSALPTAEPTALRGVMQSPPLVASPPPTPSSPIAANNAGSVASAAPRSERSIFLIGAILGACFFAFSLLLLSKIETRKRIQQYMTNVTDEKDEEIDFYPEHGRPTPPSYRYGKEGTELVLEPDGTSLKLKSDCLFDDAATQMFNREHGRSTPSPNKSRWSFPDGLSAPSQSSDHGRFEIESLDEEEVPPMPLASAMSMPSNKRVRFAERPKEVEIPSDVPSVSLFDEIISPAAQVFEDGWASFSPWHNTGGTESKKMSTENISSSDPSSTMQAELTSPQESFPPLNSSSEESSSTATSAHTSQSSGNDVDVHSFPPIAQPSWTSQSLGSDTISFPPLVPPLGTPQSPGSDVDCFPPLVRPEALAETQTLSPTPVINDNDDDGGSFHGSVESVDSLISSCWDPNDNSSSDIANGRAIPILQSSFSSDLTEEVSFYQHVSFMKWAQRAKKSLYPPGDALCTGTKCAGAAVNKPKEAEPRTNTRNKPRDQPYLSVSSSESTESFDENGFKVVNNSSFV